jgi:hypothetical protein
MARAKREDEKIDENSAEPGEGASK